MEINQEPLLTCVWCGKPILVGESFTKIGEGHLHGGCAREFENDWLAASEHRSINEMTLGVGHGEHG